VSNAERTFCRFRGFYYVELSFLTVLFQLVTQFRQCLIDVVKILFWSSVCFVSQSGEVNLSFEYPKRARFECVKCALCCGDTEDKVRAILLLKSEACSILERTLMGIHEFAEEIQSREPYVYRMRKTENGKCIFLKENSCSIYQIRPLICRFYPFQLKSVANNEYAFTYTEECLGIGKGPQLKRDFFERLFDKFIESMREDAALR
jgi:Fe-S-cluster containining protein